LGAAVTVTEERRKSGLFFSEPYMYVDEVFVSSASKPPPTNIQALRGRKVFLNPVMSHWQHLQSMHQDIKIVAVAEDTEALLEKVRKLEYDVTLMD
jgi:membrane-bound lytic murein transglycosylase F